MKKLKILLVVLISFFIASTYANAATAVINDPEGVNLRSGAGTNYGVVTAIPYGKNVTLISTDIKSGTGCSGWYNISWNGYTGYVCSNLVTVSNTSSGTTTYNGYYLTSSWDTRISEDYANVRENGSYNARILDTIYMGTKVKVLSAGSTWTKISYYNNKIGYVLTKLVKNYSDLTASDSAYEATLRSAGFPETYIPFLVRLHKDHPNWIFKAQKVGVDFSASVTAETGKNYIQSTIDSYRLNAIVAENPNWYRASSSVVAVYLDPRNYLNETNIFVFEKLSFDSANHTSDKVKSIFGSSYLSNDTYINYFMDAARSYNISPMHLASRVKQEGGTDESYAAVSGTYTGTYNGKSLKGFYNYYNIGAYQDKVTSSAVTRGLAVAAGYVDTFYGTPWNTREKAIKYGAKFIADSYINAGQDTLYLQKFNVANDSNRYTNQYMTNVSAVASESLSIRDSYRDNGILNIPFIFYIPVYNNMPSDFTTLPPMGNTNNNLSGLKINNKTVTGFDKDVLEYTEYVTHDTNSVIIDATKEASTSTMTGTGNITLSNKVTTVKITVVSESGESKIYTLTIVKEDEVSNDSTTIDDIVNAAPVKFSDKYITSIAEGTTATALINTFKSINALATIVITDKNGNEKTNTNIATGDIIKITLDNEEKTYKVSVKGDTNSNGKIEAKDLLRVQKHILPNENFTLTQEELDAADTNYDGEVNAKDLLRIQKYILKYISFK